MPNLRDALSYDPDPGILRWKICSAYHVKVGDIAGHFDGRHRRLGFAGKFYYAHRVAWFLHYGKWPRRQIDHINENKDDNRLSNLRLATNRQNARNRGKQKNNKSGFKGVCWMKQSKRWVAQICVDGTQTYLGLFDTPEEAHAVYCIAAEKHHGEFANTGVS